MVNFILGEDKHVKFAVHSRKLEPFSISSAMYDLYYDGQLEGSGPCEVLQEDSGLYLDIKISPEYRSAKYQLIITYTIADEVKKHVERMEVH